MSLLPPSFTSLSFQRQFLLFSCSHHFAPGNRARCRIAKRQNCDKSLCDTPTTELYRRSTLHWWWWHRAPLSQLCHNYWLCHAQLRDLCCVQLFCSCDHLLTASAGFLDIFGKLRSLSSCSPILQASDGWMKADTCWFCLHSCFNEGCKTYGGLLIVWKRLLRYSVSHDPNLFSVSIH